MVEVSQFKDAMAQLASAVHIVTTSGETGQHGFTASAVCSVTDSPPTLLVCVNSNARAYEHFIKNRVLMVNTLTAEQSSLSNVFASPLSQEERFANAYWTTLATGSPMLQDALINFDCEITDIKQVGTHSILICEIVAIKQGDKKEALVYHNRSYRILK
ncbi:flavin reductase [Histophilus somni]|uniref:flavin reductase n=1 Tax=Histophilus somni TaxID=731 RepID=UPI00003976BC|nr:flavin reductase [Histophilus somni]ACA32529.1 flavin reductase domain protein FMN-binding [Histophilus somni 2336]QQF86618.1 flavin reductase [Histophilus somni]QQJ89584.1 flavin reductase [Histophilus somni]